MRWPPSHEHLALFTDKDTDVDNVINAGTVDIKLNSQPVFLPIPSGYAPGDISTGEINVQNLGTLDMRYAVTRLATTETDGPPGTPDGVEIASLIKLRIGLQVNSICDFDETGYSYHLLNGDPSVLLDDQQLFSSEALHPVDGTGALIDASTTPPAIASGPGIGEVQTIGDPFVGFQSGDRVILAGLNEVLCWSVVLPDGVGNPEQGDSTTALFSFYAEQTDNN